VYEAIVAATTRSEAGIRNRFQRLLVKEMRSLGLTSTCTTPSWRHDIEAAE